MKSNNHLSNSDTIDIFDKDFEVTYDADSELEVFTPEKNARSHVNSKNTSFSQNRSVNRSRSQHRTSEPEYHTGHPDRTKRTTRRKRGVKLASPIKKGGRVLSSLTSSIIRSLTAVLILATSVYVTYTFWKASTPYGDIMESIQKRQLSQTLAAYLCPAACFLLFELISLLWSMTRVRVRDGMSTWKEDTGRGLFSFIFIFSISYVCFLFSRFIPESPEIIYGLKGACDVFGSMHNILLGLCLAGVISCLVRKYF